MGLGGALRGSVGGFVEHLGLGDLWGLIGGVCGAFWGPSGGLQDMKGLWEVQRGQWGLWGVCGGWRCWY